MSGRIGVQLERTRRWNTPNRRAWWVTRSPRARVSSRIVYVVAGTLRAMQYDVVGGSRGHQNQKSLGQNECRGQVRSHDVGSAWASVCEDGFACRHSGSKKRASVRLRVWVQMAQGSGIPELVVLAKSIGRYRREILNAIEYCPMPVSRPTEPTCGR